MAILDDKLQSRIDELRFEANQYFQTDKEKYFDMKLKAWELYPEPKSQWNEVYSLEKDFFRAYLRLNDFDEAKIWLNRMIENNNELHLHDNDIEFNIGKYYFETGDYQKAKEKWDYVVKEAGYRYFENEKSEYLDFYNNPEKYIK